MSYEPLHRALKLERTLPEQEEKLPVTFGDMEKEKNR